MRPAYRFRPPGQRGTFVVPVAVADGRGGVPDTRGRAELDAELEGAEALSAALALADVGFVPSERKRSQKPTTTTTNTEKHPVAVGPRF